MAGAVGSDNDTAKRKIPEPTSNREAPSADEDAPDAKRQSTLRSQVHEVALPEELPLAASTKSRTEMEDLRQALKARLAVANEQLPTLVAELATWNAKIQQAVVVMRKGSRLAVLDDE